MFGLRDASLKKTKALPSGAATTTTDMIDLGLSSSGDLHADCECLLEAPALTTGELGDGQTITYAVVMSDNADGSSPTTISGALVVQTGAGGAGAAAASARFRLPTTVKKYVGMSQVKTGASNASTKSGSFGLVF